mgnify:CR=1 FL=1
MKRIIVSLKPNAQYLKDQICLLWKERTAPGNRSLIQLYVNTLRYLNNSKDTFINYNSRKSLFDGTGVRQLKQAA